ncbi:MAG TPA: alpha/beta fold hydrolase [Solirubrobacteraceae bacterium]|nr:alpha/beta fold hydrolase [Solirubrobacteraceae bacterium]
MAAVAHRTIEIEGVEVFYRESGPVDAPVVLLPHGYPCSSFQFRHFMPALGDRWRLIAPDLPGFGYSATPDPAKFSYTFAGYGEFLERFVAALGPKYEWLKSYWADPTPEGREQMAGNVSEEGFRDEFVGELPGRLVERVSPDLWTLHWSLMRHPPRPEIVVGIFGDQANTLEMFPAMQTYLREHRPPTLIAWGPHDGYMPEESARAYLRDVPDAELHLLDGGHWALETNLDEIVALARDFLGRVHADQ